MPKYSAIQTELIETMAQTLPLFAPARSHRGEDGYGYFIRTREYMLEHGEMYNGAPIDLSNIINFASKKITTGSGARMSVPAFDGTFTKNMPVAIQDSAVSLQNMLKDQTLMEREPMLKSYLRFASVQFERAKNDHWDVYGFMSDSCYRVASALFNQLRTLPTAAELQQLQQSNPGAYQAAISIINLFNAFADCNAPELMTDPAKAEQKKSAATEAEARRRRAQLEQATRAFANIPRDDVQALYQQFGIPTSRVNLDNMLYDKAEKSKNPQDLTAIQAADQLARQNALMEQGLSLEEARLLWDCNTFFKIFRGDLGGANIHYQDMVEPYASMLEQMDQLSRQCGQKFQTGFASVQEKNEFFKNLGTVFGQFTHQLQTVPIDDAHFDVSTPENAMKLGNTINYVKRDLHSEYEVPYGLFSRVENAKQRIIATEQAAKWISRVRMGPAWQLLKDSGSAGLGPKDSQSCKDYQQMLSSFRNITAQMGKPSICATQRMALGENCRSFQTAAESWLGSAFEKLQNQQAPLPEAERRLTEQRVVGTLGVMHELFPEKAEALRQKASTALGRELSWNEIQNTAAANRDRRPNYKRYFELHSGEAVGRLPDKRLDEYMAKAVSGLFFMDEPNRKFDLNVPRAYASKLQTMPGFRAAMRAFGPAAVRQALQSGNMQDIVNILKGGPERYAVNQQAKTRLQQLSAGMQTEHRSKEWAALKNALSNPDMKDSQAVFNAVEDYVKGKKAASGNRQRQESVKLALDALAIVAENGDNVAKARAQILVDRFNAVRKTHPGDRNHVDLANYGKVPAQNDAQLPNVGPQHGII